jgi:hypothetical protein
MPWDILKDSSRPRWSPRSNGARRQQRCSAMTTADLITRPRPIRARSTMARAATQPAARRHGSVRDNSGISLTHVPTRRHPGALDVATGQVSDSRASTVTSLVRGGKLRLLAVTTAAACPRFRTCRRCRSRASLVSSSTRGLR